MAIALLYLYSMFGGIRRTADEGMKHPGECVKAWSIVRKKGSTAFGRLRVIHGKYVDPCNYHGIPIRETSHWRT